MSIMLKQYSSGYRSLNGIVDPRVDVSMFKIENVATGDPELVELIKSVQIHRLSNVSSAHKLQLIDCAKRLFSDFDRFVEYNVMSNNLVHGTVLDFLVDTVDFVNGGVRELPIEVWSSYVDQAIKRPAAIPDRRRITLTRTGPNYIAKWIRQPNGFEDLVSTIILMFGLPLNGGTKAKSGLL